MHEAIPEPDPYGRDVYEPALAEYMQTLHPTEVVALLYEAKEQELASPADAKDSMRGEVFAVAAWLPELNLPFAREVYQAMAGSPIDDNRETAANLISALTPFDHDFGLELWTQLVCDPAWTVRDMATCEFSGILIDGTWIGSILRESVRMGELPPEDAARIKSLGITIDEARDLLFRSKESEATDTFYDSGVIALQGARRALGLLPAANSPADPSV